MKVPLTLVYGVCAAIAMAASAARGNLITYEGFNYSPGALAGDNGGSGWTNAWSVSGTSGTVSSTGMTYTDGSGKMLPVTGGSANVNSQGDFRTPSSTPNSGTLYISFIAQVPTASGSYFGLSLFNSASEVLFLGAPNADADWGIDPKAGTVVTGTTSITNSTFLVYEVQFGASSSTISEYDNPSLTAQPGPANATTTTTDLTTASGWTQIRVQSGENANIDEIRIGTAYADVVPEPAALGLFGCFGLGLAMRRRRPSTVRGS